MPRLMLSDEPWLLKECFTGYVLAVLGETYLLVLDDGIRSTKNLMSGQKKVNGSRCLKRLPKSLIRSGYLSMAAMLKPINIAQAPKVLSHKQSVKAVQEIQLKFI